MNISIPVNIAWEMASIEVVGGHQQYITAEYMFAGLTKLQDYLDPEIYNQDVLGDEVIQAILEEIRTLIFAIEQLGIDVRQTRRMIRVMFGNGDYTHQPGGTIHRTDNVRDAFTMAEQFANDNGEKGIGVHRLVQALLQVPGADFEKILQLSNVTVEQLQQTVEQLQIVPAMPEDVPDQPPRSPRDSQPDMEDSRQQNAAKLKDKPPLERFGTNLTQQARDGLLEDVFERDREMIEVLMILSQTTKSNPILIGEPGVGKTAII